MKTDLILEGGGMRCAFTMGIVDAFLDEDIQIDDVYGISAGTIAGAPYVAGQKNFVKTLDPSFLLSASPTQFVVEDGRLSMVKLAEGLLAHMAPYDYEAYLSSSKVLQMGVIRADDLEMVYFGKEDLKGASDFWKKSMASSSLPDVATPVEIDGVNYFDGGLIDAIPIDKGIRDGHTKHVIVLTQDAGYEKTPYVSPKSGKDPFALAKQVAPQIDTLYERRPELYNETRTHVQTLADAGDAIVFYPSKPVDIGVLEIDLKKIQDLYFDGWNQAKKRAEEVRRFLV